MYAANYMAIVNEFNANFLFTNKNRSGCVFKTNLCSEDYVDDFLLYVWVCVIVDFENLCMNWYFIVW